MSRSPSPDRLHDIDWQQWTPVDRGTLLFVIRDHRVLLIHKRRGLGAGKINGPGGRLHDGESPLACAIRETVEETGVTPLQVSEAGLLLFQFVDGYSIKVWVFRAERCRGRPATTPEAIPFWVPIDAIPYHRMWSDDRVWLPRLLARQPFYGRFLFAQDRLLDYAVADAPPTSIRSSIGSPKR